MNFFTQKKLIGDLPIRFFSMGDEAIYLIQVSGLRLFNIYNYLRKWRIWFLVFTPFFIAIFIAAFLKYTLKFFLWRQHL